MGDSETVVAQTSDVMDYQPTVYASTEYNHVNTNSDGGVVATTGNTVDSASAVSTEENYAIPDGNLGDQTTTNSDTNTTMQEASVTVAPDGEPTAEVPVTSENIASHESLAVESSQTGAYDSSVNGNGSTGNDVNGTAPLDSGVAVVEQQQPGDDSAISTEEERLWSIVRANSLDFNAWTALIDETEKEAEVNILKIRKVYDAFLAEFPLCYGYWKKYADHEARLGSIEKVVEVYERAVVSVTYSVDIWMHYCVFTISTYGDPDTARRLFERGLAYVGTDYLSYPLWDRYIEYEYSQQEWCHLAMIYTRILENPNQQLDRYFNSFKELAGSRPLSDIRTTEEAAAMVASGEEVEGEVHPDGEEHTEKPASAGLNEAEELEKYVAIREEMYKKAKEFDSKIIGFETAIRRPYFHVRPLGGSELENWHNYLDFIERGDDFNKVVKLYERCLIACANYPEFWIRYVLCMEASGSMDLANNALARATQVFVKRQPEIHLFAARFREQGGDIQEARAAYQLLHSGISPGLLEAIIKHANMEYRLGNKEDAFSIYEQAIATERGKEHSQILPMLLVQYSRFLYLVVANGEKARAVLVGALEQIQLSKPILEALIHLESIQSVPKRIDFLDSLVDKFIVLNPDNPNTASTTDREELSSIFLEFLNLFGDTQSIKKAEDRHAKLFLCHRSTSESRKRNADDFLASDRTKLAKSYAGAPSPAPSVIGAYSSTQNQWPAGYGSQQQAWAQAPQAQGQQWNASYAQQTGYTGYSGYGSSYTQPQVAAASAPQAAAATYAAYPSYPAQQTFPQQTAYAQPATAAVAVIAPQQQAPVAQAAYYGGGTYY